VLKIAKYFSKFHLLSRLQLQSVDVDFHLQKFLMTLASFASYPFYHS